MDWYTLQQDHAQWSFKNFGIQQPHQMILGMIEELGELDGACEVGDKKEILDAVGDVLVYAIATHTLLGKNVFITHEEFVARFSTERPKRSLANLMGKLAHHRLKAEQNIRGGTTFHTEKLFDVIVDVFCELQRTLNDEINFELGAEPFYVGDARHHTLWSVVSDVWNKVVAKRDWKENPNNGGS